MKWLVWFLVLLNVLLLGYFRLVHLAASGPRSGEPLQAERMQLLSEAELARLPRSAPVEAVPADTLACYEWGGFSAAYVPRARSVLEQLGLQFSVTPAAAKPASRYWVYIPPLASLPEAQARTGTLQALGIRDVFIVQDARWRNAISLGIFREAAQAERFAQDLRERGVRDVVSGVRSGGEAHNSFLIKDLPSSRVGEIERLRPDFPEAELRRTPC